MSVWTEPKMRQGSHYTVFGVCGWVFMCVQELGSVWGLGLCIGDGWVGVGVGVGGGSRRCLAGSGMPGAGWVGGGALARLGVRPSVCLALCPPTVWGPGAGMQGGGLTLGQGWGRGRNKHTHTQTHGHTHTHTHTHTQIGRAHV